MANSPTERAEKTTAPDRAQTEASQAANHLHADAYHPNVFQRQWNVLKEVGKGAADRMTDDFVNFSDHPLRSTAEIGGAVVVGGALVAGSVEAGAAAATYLGITTLSTEMGALFGAASATALVAPAAEAATKKTIADIGATGGARAIVGDPSGHTPQEVQAAKVQVRQTLGSDAGGALEQGAMIAAGAGIARGASALAGRADVPLTPDGPGKVEAPVADPIKVETGKTPDGATSRTESDANTGKILTRKTTLNYATSVEQFDPATGIKVKQTDTNVALGTSLETEFDPATGVKLRQIADDKNSHTLRTFDPKTGETVKEDISFRDGSTRHNAFDPVTGQETALLKKADGSTELYESDATTFTTGRSKTTTTEPGGYMESKELIPGADGGWSRQMTYQTASGLKTVDNLQYDSNGKVLGGERQNPDGTRQELAIDPATGTLNTSFPPPARS